MCIACQCRENNDFSPLLFEVILNFSDCEKIKTIPNLEKIKQDYRNKNPNCDIYLDNTKGIYCFSCPNLRYIPKIKGLHLLECDYCPKLKRIPKIEGLGSLNCSDCQKLEYIPNIKGLQILSCNNCPQLKKIPNIDGLIHLFCQECPILKKIPSIEGLIELNCSYCPNLESIPNIKGLQILHCSECPKLKSIPNIEKLEELWCWNHLFIDYQKLLKLQKWWRYMKKCNCLHSNEFRQFFYSPTGFGGYKSKLRSTILLEKIN